MSRMSGPSRPCLLRERLTESLALPKRSRQRNPPGEAARVSGQRRGALSPPTTKMHPRRMRSPLTPTWMTPCWKNTATTTNSTSTACCIGLGPSFSCSKRGGGPGRVRTPPTPPPPLPPTTTSTFRRPSTTRLLTRGTSTHLPSLRRRCALTCCSCSEAWGYCAQTSAPAEGRQTPASTPTPPPWEGSAPPPNCGTLSCASRGATAATRTTTFSMRWT
mmetsp:Transcript_33633/g.53972  ORF Transcript_33633/g.53972 Transcript_33633/m.53972 type:complete len:218 (-) Transcript_33633:395-1048(-)